VAKPAILTVDDDPAVLQSITRDLRKQYGERYQVVPAASGNDALRALDELAVRGRPVALILSDQKMPEMDGMAFLGRARSVAATAKLVLLTAYADTDVAIKSINDLGLHHYLLKPWDPPEERLYPVLDDLLTSWRRSHPDTERGIRVVGYRWSDRSHEIKTFLARNHIHYEWLDVDHNEEAIKLCEAANAMAAAELPLVLLPDREPLRAPSTRELATALDLHTTADKPLYDLCIVGAGPAGLAGAVYGASEGLQTVIIEGSAPGGQAGQSARIENYLGFEHGLSGSDLAERAFRQARRFKAEMVLAREVVGLEARGPVRAVRFDDGSVIEARTILIASGVSYQRLEAPGLGEFVNKGVYYGANATDAPATAGEDVYVVGGANSAGQAVLNIARCAKKVVLLVRSSQLEKGMSQYLVDEIRAKDNIEVRLQSVVIEGRGGDHLEELTLADHSKGGTQEVVKTNWLFVFVGAVPRTDWLPAEVARDERGFVVTGQDLRSRTPRESWPLSRDPFTLETSIPGVFAAGDVRLDSMKRVASAVGEGAMAVHLVHRYLETM
jgi:thioredoxin reductase (NADPH)